MSVETIAFFGIARASAASAWRGPMRPFSLGEGHFRELFLPRFLLLLRFRRCARLVGPSSLPAPCSRCRSSTAASRASPQMPIDTFFTSPSMRGVGIDLDDLRVLRPVVEPVLRQRAERPEPRRRARAPRRLARSASSPLSSPGSRADRRRARGWPGTNRCGGSEFTTGAIRYSASATHSLTPSAMTTPPPDRITGNFALASSLAAASSDSGPPARALDRAAAAGSRNRLRRRNNRAGMLTCTGPRSAIAMSNARAGQLGDAQRRVHVHLPLRDLREDRHLLGLLEAAETHRQAARLPA